MKFSDEEILTEIVECQHVADDERRRRYEDSGMPHGHTYRNDADYRELSANANAAHVRLWYRQPGNAERKAQYMRGYYEKNADARRAYQRAYKANREKTNKRRRDRYKTDAAYRESRLAERRAYRAKRKT